jgi:fatty-acyl-CoA synthase
MASVLLNGDTLGAALANLARASPGSRAWFPATGDSITARELDQAATTGALSLLGAGIRPGDLVGVLVPVSARFFTAIFGLWRAGAAISVLPVQAGFPADAGAARRLAMIVEAAGLRHIVLGDEHAALGAELRGLVPQLALIGAGDLAGPAPAARSLPDTDPDSLAVVQFTSGSVSLPKGVMLPHRTMLAGLLAIIVSAELDPEDVLVQWVPAFHDMGLMGTLAEWLNGADVHMFAPATFLRRPAEVLGYFARNRGSVFAGPNFCYEHLLDAVDAGSAAKLDLSRWRLAFNGAEPVSPSTVRRFAGTLAGAGVGEAVMYPVYGMAEATLAISFPRAGEPPRTLAVCRDALGATGTVRVVREGDPAAKALVSVGSAVHGIRTRIKSQDGTVLGTGLLGEIQISGPPVTTGYYRAPKATAAAFDGSWLRTGDLGFMADGQLYVAGRLKEMVIVHGQNYFPEDVEAISREVPGVYRKRCVAFPDSDPDGSDPDGSEHVGVIVEANIKTTDGDALRREVARRVAAELGHSRVRVYVVAPRWLSRTTSGKWQRALSARRLDKEETGQWTRPEQRLPDGYPRSPTSSCTARASSPPTSGLPGRWIRFPGRSSGRTLCARITSRLSRARSWESRTWWRPPMAC